jgi:transposase
MEDDAPDTLSALIVVLEVAGFTKFPRAVQLGSSLGLVPSRQQSGESDVHGSITLSKCLRRVYSVLYCRPGVGASRRVIRPTIDHLTIATEVVVSRS